MTTTGRRLQRAALGIALGLSLGLAATAPAWASGPTKTATDSKFLAPGFSHLGK